MARRADGRRGDGAEVRAHRYGSVLLACLIGMAALPAAYAQSLKLSDYSYDTVCDFTNRYFIKLKRRIDPKEWDAIQHGKGTPLIMRAGPGKPPVSMLVYSHRGLRVRYNLDAKGRAHIWQVDLDQPRVSESLRTKDAFIAMFKVTPGAVTKPTVVLECDGALLDASFKGEAVRKLSLVMSPGAI
jgi:hypothetical protein